MGMFVWRGMGFAAYQANLHTLTSLAVVIGLILHTAAETSLFYNYTAVYDTNFTLLPIEEGFDTQFPDSGHLVDSNETQSNVSQQILTAQSIHQFPSVNISMSNSTLISSFGELSVPQLKSEQTLSKNVSSIDSPIIDNQSIEQNITRVIYNESISNDFNKMIIDTVTEVQSNFTMDNSTINSLDIVEMLQNDTVINESVIVRNTDALEPHQTQLTNVSELNPLSFNFSQSGNLSSAQVDDFQSLENISSTASNQSMTSNETEELSLMKLEEFFNATSNGTSLNETDAINIPVENNATFLSELIQESNFTNNDNTNSTDIKNSIKVPSDESQMLYQTIVPNVPFTTMLSLGTIGNVDLLFPPTERPQKNYQGTLVPSVGTQPSLQWELDPIRRNRSNTEISTVDHWPRFPSRVNWTSSRSSEISGHGNMKSTNLTDQLEVLQNESQLQDVLAGNITNFENRNMSQSRDNFTEILQDNVTMRMINNHNISDGVIAETSPDLPHWIRNDSATNSSRILDTHDESPGNTNTFQEVSSSGDIERPLFEVTMPHQDSARPLPGIMERKNGSSTLTPGEIHNVYNDTWSSHDVATSIPHDTEMVETPFYQSVEPTHDVTPNSYDPSMLMPEHISTFDEGPNLGDMVTTDVTIEDHIPVRVTFTNPPRNVWSHENQNGTPVAPPPASETASFLPQNELDEHRPKAFTRYYTPDEHFQTQEFIEEHQPVHNATNIPDLLQASTAGVPGILQPEMNETIRYPKIQTATVVPQGFPLPEVTSQINGTNATMTGLNDKAKIMKNTSITDLNYLTNAENTTSSALLMATTPTEFDEHFNVQEGLRTEVTAEDITEATTKSSRMSKMDSEDPTRQTSDAMNIDGPISEITISKTTLVKTKVAEITKYGLETTTHHDAGFLPPRKYFYKQVKEQDLRPQEKNGVITAVFGKIKKRHNKEWLNMETRVYNAWLVDTVNIIVGINQSLNTDNAPHKRAHEVFKVYYVVPTPVLDGDELIFTFFVTSNNITIPADILLPTLPSHTAMIKNLLNVTDCHFNRGTVNKARSASTNFWEDMLNEHGLLIVTVSALTLILALTLLVVIIYNRRKSRQNIHCITDADKFQQDMHISVEIGDLNSAVVILQDERDKNIITNGNHVYTTDDKDGWLVPINQMPLDDRDAPEVQDTKL